MSDQYTGFKTYKVSSELIEKLYNNEIIEPWDKRCILYPNMYIELRSETDEKHTILGKIQENGSLVRIKSRSISNLEPRNREQVFALDALADDNIPVVVLTGSAGTGKTILALAAVLQKLQDKVYKKAIITRPMSQVGKYQLGALPGDVHEKFNPYLVNYITNLEQFVGDKRIVSDLMSQMKFEVLPLQLFRGASFNNCLVIGDEMQVCTPQEILTVGTRIGENSKLILMGDLNQRDENISKDKTGIYKLINDKRIKESPLVAAIELQKCERSETSRLFASVFEE